jgi:hypothetical protein
MTFIFADLYWYISGISLAAGRDLTMKVMCLSQGEGGETFNI